MSETEFNIEQYLKKFGRNLKRVRSQLGYSQDRLGNEAGLARGTVSKIEAGKVNPQLTTVARLAETLGISAGKIVDFK